MRKRIKLLSVTIPTLVLAFAFVYHYRLVIQGNVAVRYVGISYSDIRLTGATARIYFPSSFTFGKENVRAILFMHGNGHSHSDFLGIDTLERIKNGNSIFAVIDGQDLTVPPFNSTASGWGNIVYRSRYLDLYNHLRSTFRIKPDVEAVGASMGGLAMGRFIVDGSIPIHRAFGVGPVPFIETIFANGGEKRRLPIRNAYGMALDGSQDDKLSIMARDAFWTDDLPTTGSLPPMVIVAGNGDDVFKVDFGGRDKYLKLCETYRIHHGFCSYSEVDGAAHDDNMLLPGVIELANVDDVGS